MGKKSRIPLKLHTVNMADFYSNEKYIQSETHAHGKMTRKVHNAKGKHHVLDIDTYFFMPDEFNYYLEFELPIPRQRVDRAASIAEFSKRAHEFIEFKSKVSARGETQKLAMFIASHAPPKEEEKATKEPTAPNGTRTTLQGLPATRFSDSD